MVIIFILDFSIAILINGILSNVIMSVLLISADVCLNNVIQNVHCQCLIVWLVSVAVPPC